MKNKLNILLSGASGFIGNRIAEALLTSGHSVIALCRDINHFQLSNHKNCTVVQFDFEKPDFNCDRLVNSRIDVVCHLAAFIPKDYSSAVEAEKCITINGIGTLKLLEFAKEKNIEHFIYYTSGNAYEYSEIPVKENDRMYPSKKATYYLASKLMGELYVEHNRECGALNTTIFRLSSVYGPGMKNGEFIFKCIQMISNNEFVNIYNNDVYKTDFVYVDDIVRATILCIENKAYGILNIGSGLNYTLATAAYYVADILNATREKVLIHPIVDDEKVVKGFSALDMNKTSGLLGLKPTSLLDGLNKTIAALSNAKD